jgi:hypothetical protein
MLIWLGKTVLKQKDDLVEEIKFKDCENRSEKIDRVIEEQAKGKIGSKYAKSMIDNLRTAEMQELMDVLHQYKELIKELKDG